MTYGTTIGKFAFFSEPVLSSVNYEGRPGAGEATNTGANTEGDFWCAKTRESIKAFRRAEGSSRGWLGCPARETQLVFFHFRKEIVVARV